ncbi:MAG: ComEC/Rec2 family competence protein [Treponemataceae bacterium]|nr:ComEC/Rec2 family competence protein [Treponemataceae bacterium]
MVKRRVEIIALCLMVLLYTGFLPVYDRNPFSCILYEQSIESLTGKVVSSPVKTSSGKSYMAELEVSSASSESSLADCSGRVLLYIPSQIIEALYPGKLFSSSGAAAGCLIEEGAVLSAVVSYSGSSDADSLSLLSGCIEKPAFYVKEVTECSWIPSSWFSSLFYFRAILRLRLKRLLYAWGAAGGLLLALVCGAKEYTDPTLSEAFKKAGLSHILALSGMHLSIFASLSEKTLGKMAGNRFSPFLSLVVAFLFVWFAGISPSLLRALICMCIGFFASLFGLRTRPLKTLSLAFIIHLLLSPEDAGTMAFMLSYMALSGVYAGSFFLTNFLTRILPPSVASVFSSSIGAQLFTFPITIAMSGSVIPFAVLASSAVSPLASCFVSSGLIALFATFVMPFLLKPLGCIISLFYTIISYIVRFFAALPCIRI